MLALPAVPYDPATWAKLRLYRDCHLTFEQASGKAVLVISSELPELLTVTDRILVIRQGRIVAETATSDATEESLVGAMTGA